jgi:hypothetical protein
MLGGDVFDTPEGIVTRIDGVEQLWPDCERAVDGFRAMAEARRRFLNSPEGQEKQRQELEAAELRQAAEKAAAEQRQRAKQERSERMRPIKQLALWFALCWVSTAGWVLFLGGPHGALRFHWYYSSFNWHLSGWNLPPFFWWNSLEIAGAVWFATTLIYSIMPRSSAKPH